jgi:ATP-dependent helicase/nuclease subunit A
LGDWRDVPLRPGALFVVGDPKQSIYRFRRADIDIYNIVRHRFSDPGIGSVLPLTLNFRSVPQLCEWANDVFRTCFPPQASDHAPSFAGLDAATAASTGGVFTMTHTCDRKEVPAQDAAKIGDYIRAEVDAGRRRFSDFLILTRKKKDRIEPYARALQTLNIPVEVSGAGAFGDSAEVHALTTLLRAFADPQDAVTLIAVLRGPFFGISDQDLFRFKQAGGWFSVFHEAAGEDLKASRVSAALADLRQYYLWTRVLPGPAALDRILENTGYLAFAATTPSGSDAAELLHAIDRVRQVVEIGGSLADAADALESDTEEVSDLESVPLEPGRTDVVRLMNLHKAKGLEAAVVFLADPTGGVMPRVDVRIERKGLEALGWLKIVRTSENSWAVKVLGEHADWRSHERAEQPYLQAEENRLFYVAATRAREMLVVSRATANVKFPAWSLLNDFLGEAPELAVPPTISVAPIAPVECAPASQAAMVKRQQLAHQVACEASWKVVSVTAEARRLSRATRFAEVEEDDPSKVVSTDTPSHRADAGQAWGVLIHGLLEHAMRHDHVGSEDLYRLGMWLTVDEPHLRKVLDIAVSTVVSVSKADFWQKAKGSVRSVETPFAFELGRNAVLNGVIDLLFGVDDQWQIIDYKTDIDLNEHAAAYNEQLKMYERALQSVGVQQATTAIHPVRLQGRIDQIAAVSADLDAGQADE